MDNDGIAFRNRAYNAEKTLDLIIKFLESKGLYDEYMRWKENPETKKPEWREF